MLNSLLYRDELKYEEAIRENDTNTFSYKRAVTIQGLRVKGQYKYTSGKDGDSITSSVVYRTKIKIPKHSKINGHEVMESVRVDSILSDAGYLNYVK